MEKIYTGNDKAQEMGFKNFREMQLGLMKKAGWKASKDIGGERVSARVDFGRWIADCECGGAGYVEPLDPVFFCMACGNASSGGMWRGVLFPEKRHEIEAELLERKVLPRAKMKPVEAAMNAMSVTPGLSRSWRPGETVEELKRQRSPHPALPHLGEHKMGEE